MRVGADGGIGVKYMANEDAAVVGMLGTGGMARTHMEAFWAVRTIRKLQVFSPTRENREKFGREMAAKYNMEVEVCDRPEDVYKGADIVAGVTDSAVPVIDGTLLEPGTHIVNVGGSGKPDAESLQRVDVYLRFGDAPAPDRQAGACGRRRISRLGGAAGPAEIRRRPRGARCTAMRCRTSA